MSKAVEFDKEKNIPKFSHVPMAVINPIPKKKKEFAPENDPSQGLVLASKQTKLNVRGVSQKPLPDHLIRPPIDVLLEPLPKPKAYQITSDKDQLGLSHIDRKKAKEEEKKREEEK